MNVSSSDGILRFEFDEDLLRTIEDALGSMKSESRRVLKNAVNDTARDAKKDLAKKAQETYAVKQGRFTKAMKTQNATERSPSSRRAWIEIWSSRCPEGGSPGRPPRGGRG